MSTLLFVHSPVAGPSSWTYTADILRDRGFGCAVPDLTDVASMGRPYYPKYAKTAATAVDGMSDTVILVGHSAAGASPTYGVGPATRDR